MRRRVKSILTFFLLVLYAGTMLAGQALHHLAGCDHHANESAGHESQVESEIRVSLIADPGGHDEDNCPICQFHTQAQVSAPSVEILSHLLDRGSLAHETAIGGIAPKMGSYSSRAPPPA